MYANIREWFFFIRGYSRHSRTLTITLGRKYKYGEQAGVSGLLLPPAPKTGAPELFSGAGSG
jgi:hypothetical protein